MGIYANNFALNYEIFVGFGALPDAKRVDLSLNTQSTSLKLRSLTADITLVPTKGDISI